MLSAAPGAYDNYAVPTISFLEAWQEPGISLVPTGVLASRPRTVTFSLMRFPHFRAEKTRLENPDS